MLMKPNQIIQILSLLASLIETVANFMNNRKNNNNNENNNGNDNNNNDADADAAAASGH